MPEDVLHGWTFERLLIELAEAVNQTQYGTGNDNAPVVNTDPATRDRLNRAVNRGYKYFLLSDRQWSFLERPVTLVLTPDASLGAASGLHAGLCIDQDPARYRLPGFVEGSPKGDWTYLDTNSPYRAVIDVSAATVQRCRQASPTVTGAPQYAGVRPLEPDTSDNQQTPGREVIFWPTPDREYTVEALFRVATPELADLSDRHVAGAEHDLTILALAQWEWDRIDDRKLDLPEDAKFKLDQSKRADRALRPRRTAGLAPTFAVGRMPGSARVNTGNMGLPTREIYVNGIRI